MDSLLENLKNAGELKNAPVTYVLCKIDCGDLLSFDSFLNESQEAFRKNGFPFFHKQSVKDIHIQTEHGIKIKEQEQYTYHFISADYNDGIVVSGGNIFIQTRLYKNFTEFAKLITLAHDTFNRITEMNLVRAIGIRYVDIIKPEDGKDLSFYLNSSVLSPEFGDETGIKPAEARMQHAYKTPMNSTLFLRVFAGKGFKIVPDDLIPIVEPLFSESGELEKLTKGANKSALIDTDHYIRFNPVKNTTTPEIVKIVDKMHKFTSHLFCNTVTAQAIEEWK